MGNLARKSGRPAMVDATPPARTAAREILALINRRPKSPSIAELEAIITKAVPPATESVPEDLVYGPVLGSDGKPIEFGYTNEEFAAAFCPWLRMAFIVIGYDRKELVDFAARLAAETDSEAVQEMLTNWDIIAKKCSSLSEFTQSALARTIAAIDGMEAANG